jgi:4a-hydroxytetrahydrobiopterin dehydratase
MAGDGLTREQIMHGLRSAKGWAVKDDILSKTFSFASFKEAIDFVNQVAEKAERLDHHPDIDIRYDKVTISLSSHDVGAVTDRDLELAKAIEEDA